MNIDERLLLLKKEQERLDAQFDKYMDQIMLGSL